MRSALLGLVLLVVAAHATVVCGDYEYDAGAFRAGEYRGKKFAGTRVEWSVEPPLTLTLTGDALQAAGDAAAATTLTFGEFADSYAWARDLLRQYSRLKSYSIAYIRVAHAEPAKTCRTDMLSFYWDDAPVARLFAAYPVRCNDPLTLQFSVDPQAHPVEDAWGSVPRSPRDGKHFYPSGGRASFSTAIEAINADKRADTPLTVAYYSGVAANVSLLVMRTCTDIDVKGLTAALVARYNETRVERVARDAGSELPQQKQEIEAEDPDEWAKQQLREQGVVVDLPAVGKLAPPPATRAPRPPGPYAPEAVDDDAQLAPGEQLAQAQGLASVQAASDAQEIISDGRLWPTLDCIDRRDDGTCIAAFGYVSSHAAAIDVPVAKEENWFDPLEFLTDFELPTHFEPGAHRNAFVLRWFCVGDTIASFNSIHWTLKGATESATASTARCGAEAATDNALAAALGDIEAARADLPARRKLFSLDDEEERARYERSSASDPYNTATDPPLVYNNTGPAITVLPAGDNATASNQNGTDNGNGNGGIDCGINSQTDNNVGYASTTHATPDTDNANSAEVTLVETVYGGALDSLWVYVSDLDDDATARGFQLAIYDGTADAPGALLAQTDFGVLSQAGWNGLAVSAAVNLTSHTYYWLGYNTNATRTDKNNAYNLNLPGANVRWKRHTFSLGWPSVFFANSSAKGDVQGHVMYARMKKCRDPTNPPATTAPPTTAAPTTAPPTTAPPTTAVPTTAPPTTAAPTTAPPATAAPTTAAPTAPTTTAPTCATDSGSCDGDLQPRIECTHNFENGTCVTYFGYLNLDNVTVTRAADFAHNNYFTPLADDQGQPTSFAPGRQYWVFSVRWSCPSSTSASPASITWVLNTTATVSSATHNTCPVGCDDVPLSNRTNCGTTPPPPPTTPSPVSFSSTSPAYWSSSSGAPPTPSPSPSTPYSSSSSSSGQSASYVSATASSSTGVIPTPCPAPSPCQFGASLVLYRDRNFTKPYRPPHTDPSTYLLPASSTVYGMLSLDLPSDWLADFCLDVRRVTECICNSSAPCLPFNPTSAASTGCNSPGVQKRVVYRGTWPTVQRDDFAFVTNPPAYCSGQRAFAWTMHLFAPPGNTLLVQAEWEYTALHGNAHSCPGNSQGGSGARFTCGCPDTHAWNTSCSCCSPTNNNINNNVNNNTNIITIWNIIDDQSGAAVAAIASATAATAVASATASATATTGAPVINVTVKQAAGWPLWLAVGLLAGLVGIPLLVCIACACWLCAAAVPVAQPADECELVEVVECPPPPQPPAQLCYAADTAVAVQELYTMSGGATIYRDASTGSWSYGVPKRD